MSKNKALVPIVLALLAANADAAELQLFSSDGCSSFPDGTLAENELWLDCCTAHDFAYWKGGTYAERREADAALRFCVGQVGEPAVAALMLAGVRVGGSPFLPTRFRWGYGWPWPRLYGELKEEELEQIDAAVEQLPPGLQYLNMLRDLKPQAARP